jgi:hypothetical protein
VRITAFKGIRRDGDGRESGSIIGTGGVIGAGAISTAEIRRGSGCNA